MSPWPESVTTNAVTRALSAATVISMPTAAPVFLIACHPGRDTAHRWMNVKRRLRFCHVTQDGDDEGCLRLDHLPDQREAEEIRAAIHVRRKMHISATQRVALERGRASLQRR
jgi:hypothetical protein